MLRAPSIVCVLLLSGCGGTADPHAPPTAGDLITGTYQGAGAVRNPERGWVQQVDIFDQGDVEYVADLDISLGNARIRLDEYRDRTLPQSFLDQLSSGFARVRAAGLQLIIRFQYNDGDGGDAPLPRILEHIRQLAPLLTDNSDVIAVVQAGFIGAWGEWHGSTNDLDNEESRRAVLAALLEAVPADRMIQVRSPAYKDVLYPGGPLTDEEAQSGTDRARIGHHNDCFLASDSDDGTYPDPIPQWKDYVAADGRFTPVGGETCRPNPSRSDCGTALAEARALRWSYMNRAYHPEVIADWSRQSCLDDFARKLGYRFELAWARWPQGVRPGQQMRVELCIENRGFAAMYNPRPVYLVIGRGAQRVELPLDGIDARQWGPNQRVVIEATVTVPETLSDGRYPLAVWLPAPAPAISARPDYAVQFSTRDVWDPVEGTNVLTQELVVGGR
jgi:hypothetical protein